MRSELNFTSQFCYLNGEMLPLVEAKVSVLDLGILRGFGIYEGITAFNGEPFLFNDHWARFGRSATPLGLVIPRTKEEVLDAMRTLIKHNASGPRANIRMVLTGGEAEGGLEHVKGRETLFIVAEEFVPLPAALYENGGHLITHDHQRFMAETKTIGYITAVTLQERRRAAGAIEILYTSGGRVLECATSNVFIVKDGVIATPDANILKGITRNVVIELARESHSVEECPISLEEFFDADEVFITSSFKDIVPIVSVDARIIGSGKPGPITHDLMARFAEHTKKY